MGTKKRPGTFDCYENAEDDEPMFVLLARDSSAPKLVMQWAAWREGQGEDPAKVAEARACAAAMEAWRLRRNVARGEAELARGEGTSLDEVVPPPPGGWRT